MKISNSVTLNTLFSLPFLFTLLTSTNEFLLCVFVYICFLSFKGCEKYVVNFWPIFRSSITRLSVDDKVQRSKDVSSQERDLLHKTIVERKGELESPDVEVKPFTKDDNNQTSRALPGYSPPHLEEKTNRKTLTVVNADGELEEVKKFIFLVKSKLIIAKPYRTATFSRILFVLNFCKFFS